jgi:hypothetical protein
LPLSVGNYWIYQRDSLNDNSNPTGLSFRDSLVITGTSLIEGKTTYEFTFYRQGLQIEKGSLSKDNNTFSIFNKGLMPFLCVDTTECWSKLPLRWFNLVDMSKREWFSKDSVLNGDQYPSILTNQDGSSTITYAQTASTFNIDARRLNDSLYIINQSHFGTLNFYYSGIRILNLIGPQNITFIPQQGYKYSNNNRTVVANEYTLILSFAENIGICQINEVFIKGPVTRRTVYKLVDYKVY